MTSEQQRIINTHDQLKAAGGGIAIIVAHGGIRETFVNGWYIYRVSKHGDQLITDPQAAWYNYGMKWFSNFGDGSFHERNAVALGQARAWVAEQYGEHGPWVRNAQLDYVPERIQKAFPIRREKRRTAAPV